MSTYLSYVCRAFIADNNHPVHNQGHHPEDEPLGYEEWKLLAKMAKFGTKGIGSLCSLADNEVVKGIGKGLKQWSGRICGVLTFDQWIRGETGFKKVIEMVDKVFLGHPYSDEDLETLSSLAALDEVIGNELDPSTIEKIFNALNISPFYRSSLTTGAEKLSQIHQFTLGKLSIFIKALSVLGIDGKVDKVVHATLTIFDRTSTKKEKVDALFKLIGSGAALGAFVASMNSGTPAYVSAGLTAAGSGASLSAAFNKLTTSSMEKLQQEAVSLIKRDISDLETEVRKQNSLKSRGARSDIVGQFETFNHRFDSFINDINSCETQTRLIEILNEYDEARSNVKVLDTPRAFENREKIQKFSDSLKDIESLKEQEDTDRRLAEQALGVQH